MNEVILVVEDDNEHRRLIADRLYRKGYQVVEAKNGREALDAVANTEGIDLVILDERMPNMSGLECYRELPVELPVVFLTIFGRDTPFKREKKRTEEYLQKLGRQKEAPIIVKPFSRTELYRAVRDALDQ